MQSNVKYLQVSIGDALNERKKVRNIWNLSIFTNQTIFTNAGFPRATTDTSYRSNQQRQKEGLELSPSGVQVRHSNHQLA